MNTRDLVVVSLAAALSIALSQLRLYELPQGGSLTLEMLPIFYVAFRVGTVQGITAGVLSGFVQLLVRPFIVHPAQVLLDYPLAMGACGLAGLMRGIGPRVVRVGFGVLLGGGTKFVMHFISGIVFFAAYAPEGTSVWVYSAIYNASYVLPQTILALVLLPPLLRRMPAKMDLPT